MKSIIYVPFFLVVFSLAGWRSFTSQNTAPAAPKNIILMIGDGMGLAQISASIYSQGNFSILQRFPVAGLQKTTSSNNLITDSAAAATALACGKKTYNNAVGLDSTGHRCLSILNEASQRGLSTGIVVTSSIVHATPAAFVAHAKIRISYEEIAEDFLNSNLDFFIGGGRQFFTKRDRDKRNLIIDLQNQGFAIYNSDEDELVKVTPSPLKRFGFFTADNQPLPAGQGRDYLPFAAKMALKYLPARSEKGFFLMIEGSQIDWACHANQTQALLSEMKDFEKTIAKVLDFVKKDGETLLIVTGDHETGGTSIVEGSAMKHLKLKYTSNGHTGTMVPVFAYGPQSELFRGVYDNTEIYFKMKQAMAWQ